MKILVLGGGFLGSTFGDYGYDVAGRDMFEWDVSRGEPTQNSVYLEDKFKEYDAVVNCIAKSDTRWCEDPDNFEELMGINADAPNYLSGVCERTGVQFVHISTGCLYDSRGQGKSSETDFKSAHCNYVVSKWAGECRLSDKDLILRPRLLFDAKPAEGRNNLIEKLSKFDSFLDEFNSVTSNDTIVDATLALLHKKQSGGFNVANDGVYTIHEMATALGFKGGKMKQEELHKSEGLFLVNNVMDLTKLKQFYQPRDTIKELVNCQKILVQNI